MERCPALIKPSAFGLERMSFMLKKIIAGIAGLTFAFSVVVSSGTLQTKAMETTTETTAEETTDTDGARFP